MLFSFHAVLPFCHFTFSLDIAPTRRRWLMMMPLSLTADATKMLIVATPRVTARL